MTRSLKFKYKTFLFLNLKKNEFTYRKMQKIYEVIFKKEQHFPISNPFLLKKETINFLI